MAKLEQGKYCPDIKKECIGIQCIRFINVRGAHPQTGAEIDEWDCATNWVPMLLINVAKEVRQGAAATESFRNEMVGASQKAVQTQIALAGLKSLPQFLTINQEKIS